MLCLLSSYYLLLLSCFSAFVEVLLACCVVLSAFVVAFAFGFCHRVAGLCYCAWGFVIVLLAFVVILSVLSSCCRLLPLSCGFCICVSHVGHRRFILKNASTGIKSFMSRVSFPKSALNKCP